MVNSKYLVLSLIFVVTPSIADNIWCEGKANDVYIDSSSNLMVKGAGEMIILACVLTTAILALIQ